MNQPITFLSDGGETVRNLPLYLNPLAEHVLAWFHVTMRLMVMRQLAKGLQSKACSAIAKLVSEPDADRLAPGLSYAPSCESVSCRMRPRPHGPT